MREINLVNDDLILNDKSIKEVNLKVFLYILNYSIHAYYSYFIYIHTCSEHITEIIYLTSFHKRILKKKKIILYNICIINTKLIISAYTKYIISTAY